MSQFDFGNLSSPLPGRVLVDEKLEPWRDALHSLHKGDVRPSYAVQGLMWIDDSVNPWVLKIFDGADDVVVGNIDPSSNKFLGILNPEAITGQTAADPELDDQFVFSDTSDTGTLKKSTLQKIYDKVIATLFGGSTVTPTGTELLAVSDGTNVTAQSIADLASGGGLNIVPQVFSTSVESYYIGSYAFLHKIIDGKVLRMQGITSGTIPYTNQFSILTVDESGNVTEGVRTDLSINHSFGYSEFHTDYTQIQDNKFIVLMRSSLDNSLDVALLTTDTTADTVTVNNTYDLNAGGTTLQSRGARLIKVSDTKVLCVYSAGSGTQGLFARMITLDTPTTLSIGSQQTLDATGDYYVNTLFKEKGSGDYLIYSQGSAIMHRFTLTGDTVSNLTSITGFNLTGSGVFACSQNTAGVIYGSFNNGTSIADGQYNVEIPRGTASIYANPYYPDRSPTAMFGVINYQLGSKSACIASNIGFASFPYRASVVETDNYLIVHNAAVSQSPPSVLIINKNNYMVQKAVITTDIGSIAINIQSIIAQVRDDQFILMGDNGGSNGCNYITFKIEGIK